VVNALQRNYSTVAGLPVLAVLILHPKEKIYVEKS